MFKQQAAIERTKSLPITSLNLRQTSPVAKRSLYQQSNWISTTGETTLAVVIGIIICLLVVSLAYNGKIEAGTVNPPMQSQMLGKRGWKDVEVSSARNLQIQLELKNDELSLLRTQLNRAMASSRKAESNMASQESLIKTLQQRQETEKAAKYRAMYALAERSRALDDCISQIEEQHVSSS